MDRGQRIRRHAMKHESEPRDFDLEIAKGAAGGVLVIVVGVLIALLFYVFSA